MFSTFQTKHGVLIVRTEDVRQIADTVRYDYSTKENQPSCVVEWAPNATELRITDVLGTARENFERLKREEMEAIDAAQKAQQRAGNGLPMLPVLRGRP